MPSDNAFSAAAQQLFEYLSQTSERPPDQVDGAVVFGRHDLNPALRVRQLYHDGAIGSWVIFTGGKAGKDRGALGAVDLAEADFHFAVATAGRDGLPIEVGGRQFLYRDTEAANGFDNCRNSLGLIAEKKLPCDSAMLVAHSTSLLRLAQLFLTIMEQQGVAFDLSWTASGYQFNSRNPLDRQEAAQEILRLYRWPSKVDDVTHLPWLRPQPGLPWEFVEMAEAILGAGT